MTNIVDDFYSKYEELLTNLLDNDKTSLHIWAHENFRKVLVLIMANHLENEIRTILQEFSKQKSGSELVSSFIRKSMERQYHTYFDWEGSNANRFFALFGDTFRQEAGKDVHSDTKLEEGIKAFLEIGNTRNTLIHKRFHLADIGNKTAKEFYEAFEKAMIFVEYLKTKLK
jgi:membrane-bound lytic murein transglycosylase